MTGHRTHVEEVGVPWKGRRVWSFPLMRILPGPRQLYRRLYTFAVTMIRSGTHIPAVQPFRNGGAVRPSDLAANGLRMQDGDQVGEGRDCWAGSGALAMWTNEPHEQSWWCPQ